MGACCLLGMVAAIWRRLLRLVGVEVAEPPAQLAQSRGSVLRFSETTRTVIGVMLLAEIAIGAVWFARAPAEHRRHLITAAAFLRYQASHICSGAAGDASDTRAPSAQGKVRPAIPAT